MKTIILTLALLPILAFAEGGTLSIGEQTVSYDTATSTAFGILYYASDTLIASTHDTITLLYEEDRIVLEGHDTDSDGTIDTFVTLDSAENVERVTGLGTSTLTRPPVVEFADLLTEHDGSVESASPQDLVGNSIDITIPRYHNYTLYGLILLLIVGGGYWWYRKKK